MHAPITLTITSADGRIALAETGDIQVGRLDAIEVFEQWVLPSSREPDLPRHPPLRGRIDVPPSFVEGHTATALMATIDVTDGSGSLGLMGFVRTRDALGPGAVKMLATW